MAFCQTCGAQLSGDFCTACGTRAGTASPPAAAPPPPAYGAPMAGPPVAAARKTSPIVWILVGVLGFFILCGVALSIGGFFLIHKAKQAGLDSDLMRNNPGLAMAKLLTATNPDLEVVSTDDRRGLITIRQRSTGKTMTINFEDAKRGKFTFREDGKDAVTLEAHGDGQSGSLQMKSGSESFSMGTKGELPSWMPAYPNSKPASVFSINGKDGSSASFNFQTGDAAKDIIAFYESGLKQAGFRITSTTTSDNGGSVGGLISAEDTANKRTVVVTVGNDSKGTTVTLNYSQK